MENKASVKKTVLSFVLLIPALLRSFISTFVVIFEKDGTIKLGGSLIAMYVFMLIFGQDDFVRMKDITALFVLSIATDLTFFVHSFGQSANW